MHQGSSGEDEIERRCQAFARRRRALEDLRIEDFVQGCDEPLRSSLLVMLLKLEWAIRRETGEPPDVGDFIERFPDQRGLIERLAHDDEAIQLNSSPHTHSNNSIDFGLDAPVDALNSPTEVDPIGATIQSHPPSRDAGGSVAREQNPPPGNSQPLHPGRYKVQAEVGRGGMGIVYRASDGKLGRSLAIKVLQPGPDLSAEQRQRETARFLDEAKLSAQLDHPGLVPIYELDHDPVIGSYFTMRLVKGKHLGEIARLAREQKDGWNLSRVVGVIVKACEAVAYAHSKNVIHRDLKPANVMVGRFGAVYVMDWGLAKVLGQEDPHDLRPKIDPHLTARTVIRSDRQGSDPSTAETPLITMDGSVIGTPAYMPPEQAKGLVDEVDDKSDVYSLGAILYHLLTGQPPYVEPRAKISPHTILGMVIQGPPVSVRKLNPGAPAELVAICEKAMAREKHQRYSNSLVLSEDLQAYLDGRVVRAYRTGAIAEFRSWVARNRLTALAAASVVVATVAGLMGIVGVQRQSSRQIRTAREETRRYLYDGNLQLVQQAWDNGAVFRARELLDRQIPRAEEKDLRSFAWRFFDNLCRQSERSPLLPHSDIVTSIAYSPQGDRLATGCNDGLVRLWDTSDWTMKLLAGGHQQDEGNDELPAVDQLVFTPDGSRLISLGRFGDVWLRDLKPGVPPTLLPERAYPWAGDCSPDGRYLVAPDKAQQQILIWDLNAPDDASRQPRRISVQEHERDRIEAVHFAADGLHVFTLGTAGVAKLWQVDSGELIRSFGKPVDTPSPLMNIASTGKRLAMTQGSEVLVWDTASGERIGSASGPAGGMKHLLFSNSGDYLGACGLSDAGEVMIWKIDPDGVHLIQSESRHPGRIARMDRLGKTRDGFVTSGGFGNVVRIWGLPTGNLVETFRGHSNELYGLATSPDGRYVAAGGRGRKVRVWDLDQRPAVSVLPNHGDVVWSGEFSSSGKLACTASGDGRLRLWDVDSAEFLGELNDRRAGSGERPPAHEQAAQSVHFLPDAIGDQLISSGKDGHIKLWSISRRELIGQIRNAHESGANGFDFCRDRKRFVSGGDDGRLKVWNLSDLNDSRDRVEPLRVIGPLGQAVWSLACSPTANLVAASGIFPDHKIFLWDLDSDADPIELVGHANNVTQLRFSPDGRILGSTSQDGSVRLWDVASATELPSPQSPLRGHSGDVQSMLFTPDGLTIITASMDQTIRIWDRQTGEGLCTLPGHSAGVQSVALSPDGNTILSTGWDRTARLWRSVGYEREAGGGR